MIKNNYVRYDIVTGEIKIIGKCPEQHIDLQHPIDGMNLLKGEGSIGEHYVDLITETIEEKEPINYTVNKETILADGIDEFIINDLPFGITVIWPDGQIDIINTGSVSITVDLEGSYIFKLKGVPYLDTEVNFEATI